MHRILWLVVLALVLALHMGCGDDDDNDNDDNDNDDSAECEGDEVRCDGNILQVCMDDAWSDALDCESFDLICTTDCEEPYPGYEDICCD